MAKPKSKMVCPKCGDVMNHHADKLLEPLTVADKEHLNPMLGGLIEEVHGCPACGAVESRRGG